MSYNPGSPITVIKSLSSANILALNTTPFTLVPEQGAGTIIIPVSAIMIYTFGTIAYAAGTLRLIENSTPAIGAAIMTNATGINLIAGSYNGNFIPSIVLGTATSIQTNQALQLYSGTAVTLGDGTMKIIVTYVVVTP